MFRKLRALATGAALTAALTIGVAPVLAVVPDNDLYADAMVVAALPFDQTLDTTEATDDATDTEANTYCGAPVTLASVWYAFTPATDGGYIVDVSE